MSNIGLLAMVWGTAMTRILTGGILWLVGLGILYWGDGLSIFAFVLATIVLLGNTISPLAENPRTALLGGVIGCVLIWLAYLEHTDPIDAARDAYIKDYWIGGVIIILLSIQLWAHTILGIDKDENVL